MLFRSFGKIARVFPFMEPLLGKLGGKAAKEAGEVLADAAESGTIKFVKGVATGVGNGVRFEVPQEVAQQGLERWQAGLSLTDEDARHEYGQAAIGALVLGGGLGAVEGGIASRAAPEAAPVEEAAPPAEAAPETHAGQREAILRSLTTAAGPDLSPGATAAVQGLERTVSNALASRNPEDVASARAYITAREDDIAAGQYAEDISEPFTGALTQAKQMLDVVAPTEPIEAAAPVEAPTVDRKEAFLEANTRYPDDDMSATAFYNGALNVKPDETFTRYASDLEKQEIGRAHV